MTYILVFLGGGLGAAARHGMNGLALRMLGPAFPWGTASVNVLGSLLMGLVVGTFALRFDASVALRAFLMTGFLGGFTTFSAFSLDLATLWERGDGGLAIAYALGSVILSVAALVAGLALARS